MAIKGIWKPDRCLLISEVQEEGFQMMLYGYLFKIVGAHLRKKLA